MKKLFLLKQTFSDLGSATRSTKLGVRRLQSGDIVEIILAHS